MELRAFAICPSCAELFPSSRSCPACHGDNDAAREVAMAAAIAHAAEAPALSGRPGARRTRRLIQATSVLAALCLSLVVGAVFLVLG